MEQPIFQRGEACTDAVEEMLQVCEEMLDHPLGFVIDAGGSMTKVVYRSKEDCSAGRATKPCHDPEVGVLRLRNFNMDQVGEIIGFLKENCDINVNPDDGDEEWWITGLTTQHFKKELDSTFKIKTRLFSEVKAAANYWKYFDKMEIGCFDIDLEALTYAKQRASAYTFFIEMPGRQAKNDEETIRAEKSKDPDRPFRLPGYPAKELFMNKELDSWAREYLSYRGDLEHPSLLAHLGSAGSICLISENNDIAMVDFLYGIGKMLSGLAEEMTGESNFEKFIEMAERGKLENVDMSTDDLDSLEHREDDWYTNMPRGMTLFELGRLSSNNLSGKGNFSKDDLAIGVLSTVLKLTSKIIFLNAKLHKVKSIIFSGSIPKYRLVRHHFQRNLFAESILNNSAGMDLIKVHFLKNPGFICSLGVWWENVEKHKERKQKYK